MRNISGVKRFRKVLRAHAWELVLATSSIAIFSAIMQLNLAVFFIGVVLGGIGAIGFILQE